MINKQITALVLFALVLVIFITLLPATASRAYSQAFYYTPTPLSDGRIIYVVKENDTCISIALKNGISEQQLRQLNNLQGNDCLSIRVGQEMLIGTKQSDTPTPTSAIAVSPSPTPLRGNGTICIYLFNDENGNSMVDGTEPPLAGGAISITDRLSKVNLTGTTDASGDPLCYENVPEGEYNLSVAIPEGYNSTTVMNFVLNLGPGDVSTVDFGAQPSSRLLPSAGGGERPSALLAVLGIFFIGAGVGLWVYLRRMIRS